MMWSAPASAKASRNGSTGSIIRCTSNGILVSLRKDFSIDGAVADVRHEMPVHDVQVQPVGAGGFDGGHLLGQAGEIRGEKAGGNQGGLLGHRVVLGNAPRREKRRYGAGRGRWPDGGNRGASDPAQSWVGVDRGKLVRAKVRAPRCDDTTRWTVSVSKKTDTAVRSFLAQRGMKKGDFSQFI